MHGAAADPVDGVGSVAVPRLQLELAIALAPGFVERRQPAR
jgi:hypothetical protein